MGSLTQLYIRLFLDLIGIGFFCFVMFGVSCVEAGGATRGVRN